jgi:hypothetical protein
VGPVDGPLNLIIGSRAASRTLLTRDEVWRIAANIAKLPELLRRWQSEKPRWAMNHRG